MQQLLVLFLGILCFAFTACEQAPPPEGQAFQGNGHEVTPLPATELEYATLRRGNGPLEEIGYIRNGLKTGTWTTFNPENPNFPQQISSLIDGVANGPYLEFDERGQIKLMAYYQNNKLHGPWAKYRLGRAEFVAEYKEGALDGLYREYEFRTGKMKKEVAYKAGKQHGTTRFFDENEKVILVWEFKDDVKVDEQIPSNN